MLDEQINQAAAYFKRQGNERNKPRWSRLAGIRDHGNGMRVIVAPFYTLGDHLTEGEELFLVPKVRIAEPVEWDDIPRVIALVERYMAISQRRND